jgi:hypothetical protein
MKILRNVIAMGAIATTIFVVKAQATPLESTCGSSNGASATCSGGKCSCSGCGFLYSHTCCGCS